MNGTMTPGGVICSSRVGVCASGVGTPPSESLLVEGNYTQGTGSTLEIAINPLSSTQLVVTGEVLIESGTTLHVEVEPGPYTAATYTVLTGQMITGTFTQLTTSSNEILPAKLLCQGGSLLLSILIPPPPSPDLASKANSGNTKQVAKALDKILKEDPEAFGSLLDPLFDMGSNELNKALNMMHPALFKGFAIAQESSAVKVQDTLGYRLLNELACLSCCEEKKPFHIWLDGMGDVLHQKNTQFSGNEEVGYEKQMSGVSLGFDYRWNCFYAGVLGAFTGSSLHLHDLRGNGSIQTGYTGLYLSYLSKMWYANASLIGAWSSYKAHRHIDYTGVHKTASSKHGGAQLLSHLDTGLNLTFTNKKIEFTIRPFDSFNYITQKENAFKEEGAASFDLTVDKNVSILLRNELGLSFAFCSSIDCGRFALTPKLSWVREVRVKGESYQTRFRGTDFNFSVLGYFPDRSLFSPGVSLSAFLFEDLLSLELYYNGEFTHGYSNQSYGGQIRVGF